MTNFDIAQQRLYNQHISRQVFNTPAEIVKYMGAMQAQDYAGAKWAVGLRLLNGNEAAITAALAESSIIRIHVLRPTWHFVSPDDVRWMLDLTAPRINALSGTGYRQFGLDGAVFKRSNDALAKALEGGKQLNRDEVRVVLHQAGVQTNELRFIHILLRAEVDKVICIGGRQGKQFTYALFDDRVPAGKHFLRGEALAELAQRYFTSHGPATIHDFSWWSGLALADAKLGIEITGLQLKKFEANGLTYYADNEEGEVNFKAQLTHLLPAFDEFSVAYNDRTAAVNPKYLTQARHVIFDPAIVVNGQVVGTWKRKITTRAIDVALNYFGKINQEQAKSVAAAVTRFKKFITTDDKNRAD